MELAMIAVACLGLVVLDVAALWFGHDTRRPLDLRRDWW